MKTQIKQFKAWVVFQYNTIHNIIAFKNAKWKAMRLHKATGKRYYVVPKNQTSLMVVNNDFVKAYNMAIKGKRITIKDLLEMSYFATPYQDLSSRTLKKANK